MKLGVSLMGALIVAGSATLADAATIRNTDATEYQLRILADGVERQVVLPPKGEATDLCASQCELYFGTDPVPYDLTAADTLIVKNGELLHDEGSKDASAAASILKQ